MFFPTSGHIIELLKKELYLLVSISSICVGGHFLARPRPLFIAPSNNAGF